MIPLIPNLHYLTVFYEEPFMSLLAVALRHCHMLKKLIFLPVPFNATIRMVIGEDELVEADAIGYYLDKIKSRVIY